MGPRRRQHASETPRPFPPPQGRNGKADRGMEENPRRHQLQMRVLPESCRSRNGKASLRQGQTAPRR